MGTAQSLIDVAKSYLGTTENDPRFFELIEYYNEHTEGYDMRTWDEWCACFASVCSLKSNNADATGTNVNCAEFRRIWRDMGIYREPWEIPETGWLIEYDWEQDGIPDHIGIVIDCDGYTIHVIEGNFNEVCAERWLPVCSQNISCFAAPNYDGIEIGSDEEMAECIFIILDDHEGYKKNDRVYWSTAQGFKYLPDMDCVNLLRQVSPGIAEIQSAKNAPWVWRAAQILKPELAKETYGVR